MANSFLHHEGMSGIYPPAFPALMALWAKIRYNGRGETGFALHDLQIFFTAVVSPMAYLAWRILLRPFWALLIAVPAAVLFLDPIRPYSHIVMIVLLPLLGYWLREMRLAGRRDTRHLLLRGLVLGLIFGALFLWYSGWYIWAAPGALGAALFFFPWRQGAATAKKAGLYIGVTLLSAAVVGAPLLYQMVRLGSENPDRYAFLAVYADPGYVLGWVSDRSSPLTYQTWPVVEARWPSQSGFALLLLFGVGLGLGLGLRNIMVRTAAAVLVGAWLARFWFAGHMAHDKAIQLYPRTTWIIMYCLMILAVLGMMAVVNRGSGWIERTLRPSGGGAGSGAGLARVVPPRVIRQLAAGDGVRGRPVRGHGRVLVGQPLHALVRRRLDGHRRVPRTRHQDAGRQLPALLAPRELLGHREGRLEARPHPGLHLVRRHRGRRLAQRLRDEGAQARAVEGGHRTGRRGRKAGPEGRRRDREGRTEEVEPRGPVARGALRATPPVPPVTADQ